MKKLLFGKGKVSHIISDPSTKIFSKEECNINDAEKLDFIIKTEKPDVVINCAAKTNLEYCEENKIESFKSNTAGVINLIDSCARSNVKLVHISSGCLFDGNSFIACEETVTTPGVWYTWTKNWADEIIQNYGYENYLILRPRQLISKVAHPTNMLTKFSKMKTIPAICEPNSITCIEDLREMIDHLLYVDAKGIYNCANEGSVTPYEIATGVKKFINQNIAVTKIKYQELLEILPNRRVNTLLDIRKLKSTGYVPRSATNALKWCLINYEK